MRSVVLGLLGAVQFLTRVPVRLPEPVAPERAVPWFPVVGAGIGAAVGGVAAVSGLVVEPLLAATLAVVTGLVVTGAFHEDGLGDVADAFGGGTDREQRLQILQDPRHGTYGVAAIVSSILVRAVALGSVTSPAVMAAGAVVAHVLGRSVAVAAIVLLPPATGAGLGADAARAVTPGRLAPGLLAGALVVVVAVGWWALPAMATALVALLIVGRLATTKIGGTNGDVLGAIEQVAECAVLVVVAALARRWHPWWA